MQTPPGGTILTAKRHFVPEPIIFVVIAWRVNHHRQTLRQYLRSTSFSSSLGTIVYMSLSLATYLEYH